MADFETSPHIRDEFSPMETLAMRALRRFGEGAPSTMDAETMLMFIDFANAIIDDIYEHPYWDKTPLQYYQHQSETRPIPDSLMLAGLLSKYSVDQASQRAQRYEAEYFKRMNQVLLRRKYGPNASFELQAVDYPQADGGVR